ASSSILTASQSVNAPGSVAVGGLASVPADPRQMPKPCLFMPRLVLIAWLTATATRPATIDTGRATATAPTDRPTSPAFRQKRAATRATTAATARPTTTPATNHCHFERTSAPTTPSFLCQPVLSGSSPAIRIVWAERVAGPGVNSAGSVGPMV